MMKQLYNVIIDPAVHTERKNLPGHVRQRVKQAITDLAIQPRPHNSEALDVDDLDVPDTIELRRIKIDKWRLIYAVSDSERWVWVWRVRQRPPYNYQDLGELTSRL
jgi:mRNA interferase RelE/StbE